MDVLMNSVVWNVLIRDLVNTNPNCIDSYSSCTHFKNNLLLILKIFPLISGLQLSTHSNVTIVGNNTGLTYYDEMYYKKVNVALVSDGRCLKMEQSTRSDQVHFWLVICSVFLHNSLLFKSSENVLIKIIFISWKMAKKWFLIMVINNRRTLFNVFFPKISEMSLFWAQISNYGLHFSNNIVATIITVVPWTIFRMSVPIFLKVVQKSYFLTSRKNIVICENT